MSRKNVLIIQLILWIALISLIVLQVLGIFTYEQTKYVFYFIIVSNAITTIFFILGEKKAKINEDEKRIK